jgi:hypothetical protein
VHGFIVRAPFSFERIKKKEELTKFWQYAIIDSEAGEDTHRIKT